MSSFIIECLCVVIISFIIIHVGYYIYDIYCISKYENENKNKRVSTSISDSVNVVKDLNEKNNKENESENENDKEKKKDDKKENINVKRNTSLSSMDELNDIKLSLNKMLNDLNKQ